MRLATFSAGVVAAALLGGAPNALLADPKVSVTKQDPVVTPHSFDPKNPPTDLPPLNPGESAVTTCNFSCKADVKYQVVSEQGQSPCNLVIKITEVVVTVDLEIDIWLPDGADAKLAAHERGHAEICQEVYKGAEKSAKDAAATVIGQTYSGTGPDCDKAEDDASGKAQAAVCAAYTPLSKGQAQRVSDIYDEKTDHGKNDVSPKDAIKAAFKQYADEQKKK